MFYLEKEAFTYKYLPPITMRANDYVKKTLEELESAIRPLF